MVTTTTTTTTTTATATTKPATASTTKNYNTLDLQRALGDLLLVSQTFIGNDVGFDSSEAKRMV